MSAYWYIDNDGAENSFRTLSECKSKFSQIVNASSKPSEWDGFVLVHYDPNKEITLSLVVCRVYVRYYKDCFGLRETVKRIEFSRSKKCLFQ